MRRRRTTAEELTALRQELDILRVENARLRLQQQLPTGLGDAAERAAALPALAARPVAGDRADEAAAALAQAAMIRSSVAGVCAELQTTLAHLQRSLETGAPPTELDRRVGQRRADDGSRREPASPFRVHRDPVHRVELTRVNPSAVDRSGPAAADGPEWSPARKDGTGSRYDRGA